MGKLKTEAARKARKMTRGTVTSYPRPEVGRVFASPGQACPVEHSLHNPDTILTSSPVLHWQHRRRLGCSTMATSLPEAG